jgi:hypothetical protein
MMKISPKLIAAAGSFVAAGVAAVLLGTAGLASGHTTTANRPAVHQRVAVGATGAEAIGLTLAVKPAPARIAVQPLHVTLTSTTKPATKPKATKSTDPGTCPGMGGSGSAHDPGGHHSGGKPSGH